MASKLKPSVKQYVKDARGRMTQRFEWKHYTPASTKTEELVELYTDMCKDKLTDEGFNEPQCQDMLNLAANN